MKRQLFQLFAILFLVAISNVIIAQPSHIIDFEPSGVGSTWSWVVAENGDNPPLEFISNPVSGGINTSPTVAKFIARQTGNPWALFFTDDDGQFTFDANNAIVKIMVYKSVISPVHFKVEGTSPAVELTSANTVTNQWEELTFDFSSAIGNTYNRLVIIPDFLARSQDNVIYIDNIRVPDGVVSSYPEPTVAAPNPPARDPSKVISLFSDAYTNVPVDTWRTNWSSAVLTDLTINGNPTKKYSQLDFVGIETITNQLNITNMTHLHLDVWSPNFTLFGIKLVDFGPNGVFGGGDDVEHQVNINSPTQNEWVSLDIPLSDFTGLTTRNNIAQYILVGQPTGLTVVYIDNFYFYQETSVPIEPTVAAPTPPARDPSKVISLFSDAYTNVPVDTWRTDWSSAVLTDLTINGNPTKKYSQLDFVGIETISNQLNITNMTHLHLDVWSPNFTFFGIKLVDFGPNGVYGGGDDVEHQVNFTSLAQSEWVSLDIPLSEFTGLTTRNNIAQYILVGQPTGLTTVYIDNFYFYNSTSGIKEIDGNIPSDFSLEQNYPNPFNPSTKINFSLPEASNVTLKIYNALGQEITTLVNQFMNAGKYEVSYDAAELPTGIYLYSLSAGNFNSVKKMLLIK